MRYQRVCCRAITLKIYTLNFMYNICKFCGASSTTNDKCSNCGAPIEKLDEGPALYENSKIRTAIEKHYEEASRRGFVIRSGRNETIITTIYIDDIKAFEIRSSSGSIGRYSLFSSHQNLTIAITNISKRKSVLLPGQTKCFGDDKYGLVATISELLAEMDLNLSDSRIRVDSYVTNNLRVIPISIILTIVAVAVLSIDKDEYYYAAPFFLMSFYMLFAPLHTHRGDRHYRLELTTKFLSTICLGIISLILFNKYELFFCYLDGQLNLDYVHELDYYEEICFGGVVICVYLLVSGIYSLIQTYIILRKKEFKYCTLLLIPIIVITVLITSKCSNPILLLISMGLMIVQTLLISKANKHCERLV